MAAFNKFNTLLADLANGVHDLANDQLAMALTNIAPVAGNSVLADISEISYANLSSRNITTTSSSQTGGVYSLVLVDLTINATGAVPTYRYGVVYNTVPVAGPLLGWIDRGAEVNMINGESILWDLTDAQTLFDLT